MPNTIRYSVPDESKYYFNFYDNHFLSSKVGFVGFLGDPQPNFSIGQSIVVDQTSTTPTNPSYDTTTVVADIVQSNIYGDGLRWIVKTDINFGSNSPTEGGRISLTPIPSVYEESSVKKGNFFIGVGDVPKGPTENTGYWNGITPPVGGYTIYLGVGSGSLSIYIANNDTELISLTNLIAFGGEVVWSNIWQCLIWFSTQPDKMVVNKDYETIVTKGLVLNLDPGFIPSYPRSEINLYDISTYGSQILPASSANSPGYNSTSSYTKDIFYDGILYNGPTFDKANGGSLVFDGTNDYCRIKSLNTNANTYANFSFSFWFSPTSTISPGSLPTFSMMMEAQDTRLTSATPDTYVYFLTNGQLIFASYTPTQNLAATNTTWIAGAWYHLTCTYQHKTDDVLTGTKKIYINGVLNNSASNVYSNYFNTFSQFGLGMYDGGKSNGFKGKLTKYLVYLRALSADEVLQNYNVTKTNFI
jgi:hypothetical protein